MFYCNSCSEYAKDTAVRALSLVSIERSPPEGFLAAVQHMLYDLPPSSYWAGSLTVTFANEAGKTCKYVVVCCHVTLF